MNTSLIRHFLLFQACPIHRLKMLHCVIRNPPIKRMYMYIHVCIIKNQGIISGAVGCEFFQVGFKPTTHPILDICIVYMHVQWNLSIVATYGAWKMAVMGRWLLYGGQNEWGKAVLGLAKVAFVERLPSYRVATIDRFLCMNRGHNTLLYVTPPFLSFMFIRVIILYV